MARLSVALLIPWTLAGMVGFVGVGQAERASPPANASEGLDSSAMTEPEGEQRAASDANPTHADGAPGAGDPEREQQPLVEARQRFDRGLEMYTEGDYDLALIEFSRAHELVPDYRVLYNIAQVSMMLGRYARAREALERYLREGADGIGTERRQAVQLDLDSLVGRTATLSVVSNVEGAEVLVDDELLGTCPMKAPVLLDAGTHEVSVRAPGYLAASKRITLAGRDAVNLAIELRLQPVSERERVVVEKRIETGPAERIEPSIPALVWAGWIATGALATGAAVTGVLGMNAAGNLSALRDNPDAERRDLNNAQDRAKSLLISADLLGAAALLTGGVSLYFTLFNNGSEPDPGRDPSAIRATTSVELGTAGLRLTRQF